MLSCLASALSWIRGVESPESRLAKERWKKAKHLRIDDYMCQSILGAHIVLGRDAMTMRAHVAAAKSVVFSKCDPFEPRMLSFGGLAREYHLPIFAECTVLFLHLNDPDFNAKMIVSACFPKLKHVYIHGSMGTANPAAHFPSTVQWVLTFNCPEFASTHTRVTYGEYENYKAASASPSGSRISSSRRTASGSSSSRDSDGGVAAAIGIKRRGIRLSRRISSAAAVSSKDKRRSKRGASELSAYAGGVPGEFAYASARS